MGLLSSIGGLIGLAVGGPLGAALGSGIGSLAGGGDIGDALKAGVLGLALARSPGRRALCRARQAQWVSTRWPEVRLAAARWQAYLGVELELAVLAVLAV
jgi:hypothetical protein